MSIGSIGSWTMPPAGSPPADLQTQHAQANAQAETLQALMGTKHTDIVAARVTDGKGVDLYT